LGGGVRANLKTMDVLIYFLDIFFHRVHSITDFVEGCQSNVSLLIIIKKCSISDFL